MEEARGAQQRSQQQGEGQPEQLQITLFRNGFMLSDQQVFRAYEDPQNKKFLEELHEGVVPSEIQSKYKKGLDVGIIDRKDQDYQEPPKPVEMFQGQGVQLGSKANPTI